MAISEDDLKRIREELETSFRPIFFFDDDPDGLSSFLLFYRFVKEGKGVVIKASPELQEMFVQKAEEYEPDKVFILDKPDVSQDFLDKMAVKTFWIDHHEPKKKNNVSYFNPRIENDRDNRPTSYWCYKVVQQDLWIAMIGIVGDWYFPEFASQFSDLYPDLLPPGIDKPEDALYKTELGRLARIFSFVMKGKTVEANTAIKILTRIKSPYEILKEETPAGKFIYKKYQSINKIYEQLLEEAIKLAKSQGQLVVYIYPDNKMSFTGDLSNELIYNFPDKIILVGRFKNGEMKCSLRSARLKLEPILKKALEGIDGYGGGHEMACGACIKKKDWERFIENFQKLLTEKN
jgi:hypothetical protein